MRQAAGLYHPCIRGLQPLVEHCKGHADHEWLDAKKTRRDNINRAERMGATRKAPSPALTLSFEACDLRDGLEIILMMPTISRDEWLVGRQSGYPHSVVHPGDHRLSACFSCSPISN